MIKIAIVEDEKESVEYLRINLDKFSKENGYQFEIDVFNDGLKFVESHKRKYDIILLDIKMPLMDGITMAKKIRETDEIVTIIFITNMAQFAINGYEVNAFGYLLKPLVYAAFSNVIKKALVKVNAQKEIGQEIVLIGKKESYRIQSSMLKYVESRGHTLFFYMETGIVEGRKTLSELENALKGEDFIRINNSYLVNLKYVRSLNGDMMDVDGAQLPISRKRKRQIVESFMNYARKK